ncbi:hypothetical protein ABZS66_13360 [Dactylosporangium sp. NPDC005572]|uniref:hypothetical protein n=1 Tax=Dactylosporangium sp. NPDC005572 TaxID=3156889 RepID=UPI0033AD64C8
MRRSTAVPLSRSYLALASLAASAGLTAACGSSDRRVYCGDRNGVIVEDSRCDGRDGYFFYSGSYPRGMKPGQKLKGGTRIAYNDSAGRTAAGLPATGKVSNGHVVSGGFGSGGSSSKSGKSGG